MFGSFEREEFKKFLRLGSIFAFIIGTYWAIRPLKNVIFSKLVHQDFLPFGKTLSMILFIPAILIYTKLLDRYGRERMLYILAFFYGFLLLFFSVCFYFVQATPEIIDTRVGLAWLGTKSLGYIWYFFVESFGSLVVALFWAFTTDTTSPESAKKGFPLVVAFGQFGGIITPFVVCQMPRYFGLLTDSLPVFVCALLSFSIIYMVRNFLKQTPASELVSYQGTNEKEVEHEQEPGMFEGLRLLLSRKYLLGIFGVLSFFEIIVTIFDYKFQCTMCAVAGKGAELTAQAGYYASLVNLVALVCLLFGISNVTRLLGVTVALVLIPLFMGGAMIGYLYLDSYTFLLALMAGCKAIHYALNGPTLKQLYIPTTKDVRFKAQAWIETFGSRAAKETGSLFNMLKIPMITSMGKIAGQARFIMLTGYIGLVVVIGWLFTALFLGKTYNKAMSEKKMVC